MLYKNAGIKANGFIEISYLNKSELRWVSNLVWGGESEYNRENTKYMSIIFHNMVKVNPVG